MAGILLLVRTIAAAIGFIDDDSHMSFIDDNSITSFIDDNGVTG